MSALQELYDRIVKLEADVAFLGGHYEDGQLVVDMAKHNAAFRCEQHRHIPYTTQNMQALCVLCLRDEVERLRTAMCDEPV